jgi:hypothetical protein
MIVEPQFFAGSPFLSLHSLPVTMARRKGRLKETTSYLYRDILFI